MSLEFYNCSKHAFYLLAISLVSGREEGEMEEEEHTYLINLLFYMKKIDQ